MRLIALFENLFVGASAAAGALLWQQSKRK
jgi:hypothetical protein